MKRKILIFLLFLLVFSFYKPGTVEAEVMHLQLDGEINNAEFAFIDRNLIEAETNGYDFVIIEINSLGGYVDPALKIRDSILESEVEVITFVSGRAWSAAALIALAGEELYISPSASIGAAETRPNEEKYISALRTEFAATAESRNKNPQIAEAMVDASLEIEGIIETDRLLTLTAAEALEYQIADYSASSLADVAAARDISLNQIVTIEKSNLEKIMGIISSPYISSLVLIIAFSALIFEALTPGFALGGTVGIIALSIFFASHIFTGAIGTGIVVLFIVGVILILAEVFVIPGFGIAGVSGITAVLVSLFFIFPNTSIAINVLLAVVLITLMIAVFMIKKVGSSRFWRRISLESNSKNYFSSASKKDYLNREAETMSKLRPAGTIRIDGKRVDAVSEGGFIEKGKKVKVISVSGSRIVVREISEEE
ncbi:membrane-bound serine protease (ClpP class) [Halanaerobium saccharolyticum]|uniref:Membrane-bound serine protease (ClpP class) n=1 Tax=Halanaerobium saccharolyticum TaxID=43595 RepID=A0A4R7Z3D0_9FIRM|nr:NfeD family protein [Halanaerobium saccharolyticum]RAK10340.1 membrane-bound serine protease (ClpP class) [Halanaerobium saccharolyticum]TDW05286.1 membrane-bound serine protease (ClpP class) [Halanaerobium saccharolyticum]TDX60356.1 membrane-bound serine protease (ClpP class) [Halanaerobium saccharolyticum]